MTSKLWPHLCEDSGVKLFVRKVSPNLMYELRKLHPDPVPPLVEVDYGEGGKRMEPNESAPSYLEAVKVHHKMLVEKTQRLMMERGVVIELDAEQKEEVTELRDWWLEENGVSLEGSDKLLYVMHLAVGSQEDLEDLLKVISRRSQPTEEAISEAEATFRA